MQFPEHTGYIYLWRDSKRGMYYLGSHQGLITDGYLCSSKRCLRAIKQRPSTLHMRVIQYFAGDEAALRQLETSWLQQIKPAELGKKYYNLKRVASGGNTFEGKNAEEMKLVRFNIGVAAKKSWASNPQRRRDATENAFGGNKFDRSYMKTEKYSVAMSAAMSGEKNSFFGKTHSVESRAKMSAKRIGTNNRAMDFVFTDLTGTEILVKNLTEFLREHGQLKLTTYLKSGKPITPRYKKDHPLTGWKVRYAAC